MDNILGDLFEGLDIEATIIGTMAGRWVQLELSGEDEEIATNLLAREVGFCPVNIESIKKFSSVKGYVIGSDKAGERLSIDIGLFQPNTTYVTVPLSQLQTQLAYGKKLPLKKICELWGITENLPLKIKVLDISSEEKKIEAEIEAAQIRRLILWRDSLLDRLLVFGASRHEINFTIEQEGLNRDIIDVESLGMFENALICKLGTDGTGLISKIGKRLRKAKFTVFNPKKILALKDKV